MKPKFSAPSVLRAGVPVVLFGSLAIATGETFWNGASGTWYSGNWGANPGWSGNFPGQGGETYGTIANGGTVDDNGGGINGITRLVVRQGSTLNIDGPGIDVTTGSGRVLIESGGTIAISNGAFLASSDYVAVGTLESFNTTAATATLSVGGDVASRLLTNYMGVGTAGGGNGPNNGVVNHSNGAIMVRNELIIGDVAGATGAYNLSGTAATVDNPLNGTFLGGQTTQYGGNDILDNLVVGKYGAGVFSQTGGAVGLNGSGQSTEIATVTIGLYANTMNGGSNQASAWTKSGGTIDGNQLIIGGNSGAAGVFTNSGGGEARFDVEVILGNAAGASGTFNNTGADLRSGDLIVGNGGTGVFANSGTGTTGVQTVILGANSGSTGSFTLNSANDAINDVTADDFIVGSSGSGTLTVTDGNLLVNINSLPRDYQAGDPSILTNGDTPRQQRWMVAGLNAGSTGVINLNGGATTTGDLVIGRSGTGVLNITGSAWLATDNQASGIGASPIQGDFVIADQNGSSGVVNQDGGAVYIYDDLWVGRNSTSGTASYTANGGTVHVDNNDASDNFNIAANVGAGDTLRITSNSNAANSFVVDGHTDVHGTLTGAGRLSQASTTWVTIKSGGNITPDDSLGVALPTPIADFTVNGQFKMEGGSTANMQIAAGANVFAVPPAFDTASYDQVQGINSTAAPQFDGLVSVTNALAMATSGYQLGMAFDLFNWDNESTVDATGSPAFSLPALPAGLQWFTGFFLTGGDSANVPSGYWLPGQSGAGLTYNPGTIIVIPEPSPALMVACAGLTLAVRRRRR